VNQSTHNPIRVGIFADDLNRRGKGTAVALEQIVKIYSERYRHKIDLSIIVRAGTCAHPVCRETNQVQVPWVHLPKYAGFFSYLRYFLNSKETFDIIHFPRPALHPFFWLLKLRGKAKKIVVTFHGAPDAASVRIYQTPLTQLNRFFIKWIGKYFIDVMIADADGAIDQIANYYKLPRHKIVRVYLAAGNEFFPLNRQRRREAQAELQRHYGIPSPYLLSVARFDPHKNVHRLVEAFFQLLTRAALPHTLVLVGGSHEPIYSALVERTIHASVYRMRVYQPPYIAPAHLPLLYAAADVLAFVSLSEGFGLPLVEAMKCGIPVVASDAPVLPEIAGGAALLVDPFSVESITEGLHTVLADENVRADLASRGIKRAEQFSWEETAAQLFHVYENCLRR